MKKILCISDLHVGHMVSIMPDKVNYELDNGDVMEFKCNPTQQILFDEWVDMINEVGKVDAVFNLGDNTDGPNRAELGRGCWTNNLELQADAAFQLLSMIKAKKHFMVTGSNYHIGQNLYTEFFVAEKLRSAGFPVDISKELLVDVEDGGCLTKIHLLHDTSVSRSVWMYRTTPVAKEMMLALMNEDELGKVEGIIRGHCHTNVLIRYGSSFGLTLPSWKLRDTFAARMGLASIPRVGWVLLEVDGDDVDIDTHIVSNDNIKYIKEVNLS